MITIQDLKEAIAECQGVRNPNSSVAIKLAAFYIILDHMQEERPMASYDAPPRQESPIEYQSDTEFGRAVQGKDLNDVWPVIDELMETLKAMQPRLYDAVLRRL